LGCEGVVSEAQVDEDRSLTNALYVAAVALGRTRDAEEVVRVALAETQRATGVEAASLHLLQAEQGVLILREYAGTTPAFRDRMTRLLLAEARLAETAIRENRIVACSVEDHPVPALRALYLGQGFRYVTVVPVAGRERILGVMHLASRRDAPLVPPAIAMVQAVGGLVGVALENATLREVMVAQQDRLRALAEGAVRAREEEARRIAHELHDEAGQLLASVHMALDELVAQVPERSDAVQRIHALLDRVEGQLRRLSRELRPTILDDLGLGPAIEWLAQGAAERTGVSITVHAPITRLPSAMETALYRIIQEAVTNAMRHAGASTMEVRVWQEDTTVHAAVRDDGRGFDAEATMARRGDRGLGLIGMRERVDALGGRFILHSAPGQGTEVSVAIPILEDL
jgi:signal transduction histidine kinase